MRNFISEDDIEQAILSKLKAEPFEYSESLCVQSDLCAFQWTGNKAWCI